MKLSNALTLIVVVIVAGLIARDFKAKDTPVMVAARDTMRVVQIQRDTVTVTIRVQEKAKARIDTLVRVVNDTQLVVRDSIVTVPPLVVERIVTDSSLILSYKEDRRLDSLWHIQDAKLPHKPESPWGIGATCGVDPFNTSGPRCTIGVTYRARLRLPFLR